MIYVRTLRVQTVFELVGIDWRQALGAPGLVAPPIWTLTTPVATPDTPATESQFWQSVSAAVEDPGMKAGLLLLLTHLNYAARYSDYTEPFKNSCVHLKKSHEFSLHGKKHKIWKLKSAEEGRICFFPCEIGVPKIVLLAFHHDKNKSTPLPTRELCEAAMTPFLQPMANVQILKEM